MKVMLPINYNDYNISIIKCNALSDTLEFVYKFKDDAGADLDIPLSKKLIIEGLKTVTNTNTQNMIQVGVILIYIFG